MIQSYPILGPFAKIGFSVPRNHREELKVLHATLLDCWDKGLKLVLWVENNGDVVSTILSCVAHSHDFTCALETT